MAARSVDVTFRNLTSFQLELLSTNLDHGEWFKRPESTLEPDSIGLWSSVSNGFMTGTEGTANFGLAGYDTTITLHWDNPFAGGNSYRGDVSDGTYIKVISVVDGDGEQASMIWELRETSSQRDGIPDDWKRNGVTVDDGAGTGNTVFVELAKMGASVDRPDIFVHVDWMGDATHDHKLSPAAIKMVVEAFDKAPYDSPTGARGINLHVDAGPNSIMNFKTGATWGSLSRSQQITEVAQFGTATGGQYDWSAVEDAKDVVGGFYKSGRNRIFHYCASVHGWADSRSSGKARKTQAGIGGSDFIVSLGALSLPSLTDMNIAGTFMHELGHNLGLRHGGTDDFMDKPNYVSIMNYLFQFDGLIRDGVTDICDYSNVKLRDLDENRLDETTGLGADAAKLSSKRWSPAAASKIGEAGAFVDIPDLNDKVDWDDDGSKTNNSATFDVNGDSPVNREFQQLNVLVGCNDWKVISLRCGAIGGKSGQAATLLDEDGADGCLDVAHYNKIQLRDITAPVTTPRLEPAINSAGWSNGPVEITFDAEDDISGTIATMYTIDGSSEFLQTHPGGSVTVSGEGTHTVRFFSRDRADNQEIERSITFNIDMTPPEALISYDPYRHAIVVRGVDALSGTYDGELAPMSVAPLTWRAASADVAESRVYRIFDYAGNHMELELHVRSQEDEYELNVARIAYSREVKQPQTHVPVGSKLWPNTVQFRRLQSGRCCGSGGTLSPETKCCGKSGRKCLLSVLQRLTVSLDEQAKPQSQGAKIEARWDILHDDSNIVMQTASLRDLSSTGPDGAYSGEKNNTPTKDEARVTRCQRLCGLWKLQIKTARGGFVIDTEDLITSAEAKESFAELRKTSSNLF